MIRQVSKMSSAISNVILDVFNLGRIPWKTEDPFLFLAYHYDHYPKSAGTGNDHDSMGVSKKLLAGRDMGSDFGAKDGFSMYHGMTVPGFPSHPHYGFETVTVVREGAIDHSDSAGASARYGDGDAQWLTAGSGICHSEMFPLVNSDKENPLELFQLWLNLPAKKKKSPAFFSMAWAEEQPVKSFGDQGKQTHVRLIGGKLYDMVSVPPPPDSYASMPESEIIIATMKLEPNATITLPKASSSKINRMIYFFRGKKLVVASKLFENKLTAIKLKADEEVVLENKGDEVVEIFFLQGKPIGEPVVQQGPFVTSSREELYQVYQDYRSTNFGKWTWGRDDPVHPRGQSRFYTNNGKLFYPPGSKEEL